MENLIKKIKQLAHKQRFSLYYKTAHCRVRVYFQDGKQHVEDGIDILDTLEKMINYLEHKEKQI